MIKNKSVTVIAPASVANVGAGFDIVGFALDGTGDRVTVTLDEDGNNGDVMNSGPYGNLIPVSRLQNTAGVAVDAFLVATGRRDAAIRISLEKNLPLGSGLGSSASSSAAAVYAVNILLGNSLPVDQLVPFAMEGERIACGTAHADNVAPALLGGFVLIRSYDPLDLIRIKCPEDLFCAVVHPHIELKTSDARRILKRDIPIGDVIKQTANSAAFIAGMISADYDLIGRSMTDLVAEPKRTQLIPGFLTAKKAAMDNGALGCGISGSGPSVFALCRGEEPAGKLAEAIKIAFNMEGLESEGYVSSLNAPGASVVKTIS
jgi:homoserine kinase